MTIYTGPPAQKVDSLSISPTTLKLKMGESAPLKYTIVPAGAEVEIWSSENPRIAFERNGRIYAGTMEGTTVITAYADRGRKSATCTVTVSKKEEVKYPLCYEESPVILTQTGCSYMELNDFARDENYLKQAVRSIPVLENVPPMPN